MSEYVPLREATELDMPFLRWDVQLPDYAPDHTIGLDVEYLRRIGRIAGFQQLHATSYGGPHDSFTPDISLVGSDGTVASALKATRHKAHRTKPRMTPITLWATSSPRNTKTVR